MRWRTVFGDIVVPLCPLPRCAALTSTIAVTPPDWAEFVQYVNRPSTLAPGDTASVGVRMKNKGTTTWRGPAVRQAGDPVYVLVPTLEPWGVVRVDLPPQAIVVPEGSQTLSVDIQAPTEPGVYAFQWQMAVLDAYGEPVPFGLPSTVTSITVGFVDDATFENPTIPTLTAGEPAFVSVVATNAGTTTWGPGEVGLRSMTGDTWGTTWVPLDVTVARGESHVFPIPLTVPLTPGSYPFQWTMARGDTPFGTPTSLLDVLVGPSLEVAREMTYYELDGVGSVRVSTDEDGEILRTCGGDVIGRHDYLPFGEEIPRPIPSTERKRFTGQERDTETRLDYFGARYYRAGIGRFTTVDPEHASASPDDPQSWNAYAYARNNPLKYVDPDGRRWFTKNGNAVWVDPNKDGSYTSPGEGWVELDPKNYDYGMNVAFVNGQLSRIGEDADGHKMLAPWMAPEQGLEDTTFSLLSTLWLAGSAVRAGAAAITARQSAVAFTEHGAARAALREISQADVKAAIQSAKATGQVITKIGKYGTPQNIYTGTNGVTVVVEQAGRNAGKVVTVFRPGGQ